MARTGPTCRIISMLECNIKVPEPCQDNVVYKNGNTLCPLET